MLTVYRYGIDKIPAEKKIIHDVEDGFKEQQVEDNEINRELLQYIDLAKYSSKISFIDRFGYKLSTMNLSTGCKTAILVSERPNDIIDTIECGKNAIEGIVAFCRTGSIIIHRFYDIETFGGVVDTVDVKIGNTHFTSMEDLNRAIEWRSGWNEL
jgi:hypothetical protein